jgi:hypothetical protein
VPVRIWDIDPQRLCRQHLLGEHRELHAIWSILTQNKKGYACHPETLRWQGKLKALFFRHQALVAEMVARGYAHKSPLPESMATGEENQDAFVDTYEDQLCLLREKGCPCDVGETGS